MFSPAINGTVVIIIWQQNINILQDLSESTHRTSMFIKYFMNSIVGKKSEPTGY